ncbi:MAG TPA: hypothetical protein VIY26_07120, partial [Acidimicrobiales bacterium]
AAGYVGWVAGAPIVGWVSEAWGPARGLQVLAAAAFSVAIITLVGGRGRGPGLGRVTSTATATGSDEVGEAPVRRRVRLRRAGGSG